MAPTKRQFIADELRRRINSGTYPAGGTLPPQRVFMAEFGASRETVRDALGQLAAEGLITQGQGSEARVCVDRHPRVAPGGQLESALKPHEDPEVRAKVLATVTHDEARRTLHSRAGKVWRDVLIYELMEGFAGKDKVMAAELRSSVSAVTGYQP